MGGGVSLLPPESSGSDPWACFRMLSKSQCSGEEALNRSFALDHLKVSRMPSGMVSPLKRSPIVPRPLVITWPPAH